MALSAFVFVSFAAYTLAFPFVPRNDTLGVFTGTTFSSSCPITGIQSCHNTSSVSDLCCFESPGGLLLQTQFWDTNPSTGPSNSWTIHGLWPDRCDQTFAENCDPPRAYTGISSLLNNNGASDTLAFMNNFWVDINGKNEQFWEHEWATHGTCMSTLSISCMPNGSTRGQEAVAYFQTVVKLFKSLPTYMWLANAGITPSSTKTYTLSALMSALKSASGGFTPALGCSSGSLDAISWYFNLKGSVVDGAFMPINAPASGSCPSTGIKYTLKSGSPTTTETSSPSGTTTPSGLPTMATFKALQSGAFVGGLLSLGTWSTQTLATFTISGSSSSFTMTSSKGNCGVSAGVLSCGNGAAMSSFSALASGSNLLLASGGNTVFSSSGKPSGTTVFPVFPGDTRSQKYALVIVDHRSLFGRQKKLMPPPADHPFLHLTLQQHSYFVTKLQHDVTLPPWVLEELKIHDKFFSITRTQEEVSIIGEIHDSIPKDLKFSTWGCIKVMGPMEHNLTGIMSDLTAPLKAAKVPILTISTWNTDYVLVPIDEVETAIDALAKDGWKFT